MEWNEQGLKVIDHSPKLAFSSPSSPITWRATHLLQDSEGKEYAVAVAIDAVHQKPLFIQGASDVVPYRRVFLWNGSVWDHVAEDEKLEYTALRVSEGK